MKIPKISRNTKIITAATAVFVVLVAFMAYKFGILRYIELKSETGTLKEQIDSTVARNKMLMSERDSLENKDRYKIERVAREKYNMLRKGEKVFKVVDK